VRGFARLLGVVDPLPRERRALALAVGELRARRRMTQEDLAHAAGVSRNYIGELEQARRATTFEALILVARGLGVPMRELVDTFEARLRDAD
jgi:transcriptional regulator with XRE-family HTH domain